MMEVECRREMIEISLRAMVGRDVGKGGKVVVRLWGRLWVYKRNVGKFE